LLAANSQQRAILILGLVKERSRGGARVRDLNKPMAVTEYTVLPPNIVNALPSPDVMEAGLEDHLHVPRRRD
jgi:hypothetical protein